MDPVIIIDSKGLIEYMNPAAEKIFQYKVEELKGKNIKALMPKPHSESHDMYIENYLKTRKPKVIGKIRVVEGLKKDGSRFPLELGVSEVRLKSKIIFTGVLKDLTEKKKSDLYLASIAYIQEMYINGASKNEIFDSILKFLLDYTGSEYGFIGAIFKDNNQTPYLKTYAITNI